MARVPNFAVDIGWRALLKDLGLQAEHVLRRAGLPDDLFSRPENGLTTDEYFRFWKALESEVGDPRFPLRVVDAITTEMFSPPLFAALCSSNLAQASRRLAQYKRLVAPMRLDLETDERGNLTLVPVWLDAVGEPPFTVVATELAFLAKLARLGTRESVAVLRVTLPRLPEVAMIPSFEEFFGCKLRRDPRPSVTFSAADVARPFLTASDAMSKAFEPELGRRLADLDHSASTVDRVRTVLAELLPGGESSIESVAKRLAMSTRTLQRRLESEGGNFRQEVGRTRERLARHYLKRTNLSGREISFLLGYEDSNSFYRAFHEWTGQTPESARLELSRCG